MYKQIADISNFTMVTFSLTKATSLVHLDLSYNSFNDEAALEIVNTISNNAQLRELKLSDCEFSINGLKGSIFIT